MGWVYQVKGFSDTDSVNEFLKTLDPNDVENVSVASSGIGYIFLVRYRISLNEVRDIKNE